MVITPHTQTEKGNKVELASFPNTKENRNKVKLGALWLNGVRGEGPFGVPALPVWERGRSGEGALGPLGPLGPLDG